MPTLTSASLVLTVTAPKGARPAEIYTYSYLYKSGPKKGEKIILQWSKNEKHKGFSGQPVTSAFDNVQWLVRNRIKCDDKGCINYSDVVNIDGHPAFVENYRRR